MFLKLKNGAMIPAHRIKSVSAPDSDNLRCITPVEGSRWKVACEIDEPETQSSETPIVPALPGYFIIDLPFHDEVDDFVFHRIPIIAWRISEFAEPITFTLKSNRDWAVLCPDDRVMVPDAHRGRVYETPLTFTAAINRMQAAKRAKKRKAKPKYDFG